MITATQARKNTIIAQYNLMQQVRERARLFCEKKIFPVITTASKDGENHVFVDIDEDIDINEVKIKLLVNSFEIGPGINGRSISIMW